MEKIKFQEKDFDKFKKYFSVKEKFGKSDKFFLNKTYKYTKILKYTPGIKMLGICNSISMYASKESSDIDLFVITSKNRMWFVRIILTLFFFIIGQRKTKKKHTGKFCLSFFCTEYGMDFSDFALKNDIYLYFWCLYLKPIINFDNTYEKFLNSQKWANFKNYDSLVKENKSYIKYSGKSFGDKCIFFDFLDSLLKKIFLPKTLRNFKKLDKPYGIIINDNMLKFHNNDKRKEIADFILVSKNFYK